MSKRVRLDHPERLGNIERGGALER
jgi:hypothetical protein